MPRLAALLRNLFRRARVERDLDAELRAYLDLATDENRAAGLPDEAARRAALLDLGGVEQVKEQVRDARTGALFDHIRQDLVYAIRMLRKNASFTAMAVATLALGIGATTAVFSIVDSVVFRPLPYADPDRLVRICGASSRDPQCVDDVSRQELESVRRADGLFEAVAADDGMGVTVVAADGSREALGVGLVTTNWLSTLGVRPLAGRAFQADEGLPGRDRVLILTYDYWTRRFGASPQAIGSTMTFDGIAHTIVGVVPPNVLRHDADVLKPLALQAYTERSLDLVGRLKPGVSLAQTDAVVDVIGRQDARDSSGERGTRRLAAVRLGKSYAEVTKRATDGLIMILGAVALVLLIACANVANLLLARVAVRRRESVVRAALGASRGRLVRQALVETTLLFAIGGAGGMVLARILVDSLRALAISGGYMPERMAVSLDARILSVTMGLSLLTGVAFGLIPAIQSSRVDVNAGLRASGLTVTGDRRRGRARKLLIVSEVALSVVLLAGFGLLIRSFARVYATGGGFDPTNVVVTAADGSRSFGEAMVFWRASLERARALPGVVSAALTSRPPANNVRAKHFHIAGAPPVPDAEAPYADDILVSDGYFETLRIPLLKGRTFTAADNESSPPVVIISQSVARRYFGAADPLGRSIRIIERLPMTCCATPGPVDGVSRRIVGVVGDVRQVDYEGAPSPSMYRPYAQIVEHDMYLVARADSRGHAAQLTRDLRAHLLEVDPARDWTAAVPFQQMIWQTDSIRLRRFVLTLLGTFAALALILAAVGIYGVASGIVSERTREIGVRIALGATRPTVFRQIAGEMGTLAGAGAIAGTAAALALTRVIAAMLFGITATDAVTYLGVISVLGTVVMVASWIPAHKATRIDPLVALRHD